MLSTPDVGLIDGEQKGVPFTYPAPYGSHVMENILFKVFPAQFRAQTAMEAVTQLHPLVKDRLGEIERVDVYTHERALRTVDKRGPLGSASERDHCMQYIVAVGLIFGCLEYRHYHDDVAADPRIDELREKIVLLERPSYTAGFEDSDIRSDATAIRVGFSDGSSTDEIEVLYPLGDKRRRDAARTVLEQKFRQNVEGRLAPDSEKLVLELYGDPDRFRRIDVAEFMAALVL